jgi:hypothetical protein
VKIDDLLTEQRRGRRAGRPPRFTDAELVTVAVAQAVLQVPSERRWLRIIDRFLAGMFPHRPQQPGYNKRLRAALPLLKTAMRELATDCDFWHDDVWIIDSTPVDCARSIATRRRCALAGWASYGHRSAHNRFFWGLRLHLVCTPHGLRVPPRGRPHAGRSRAPGPAPSAGRSAGAAVRPERRAPRPSRAGRGRRAGSGWGRPSRP